ncbi:unnamed protein product [Closterium sp. Yama58-4]|nr:unnamed protein product [Closterium sp. Yama58-4]
MASSASPRPGGSLSFHAPPSGSTCIGSRRESSKHGDPASIRASALNRAEENIGRLSSESFMSQRCSGGGHPRHSSSVTTTSASFADNAGPSSPDEVPVRIGSSLATPAHINAWYGKSDHIAAFWH